jgi:hypothetical protein
MNTAVPPTVTAADKLSAMRARRAALAPTAADAKEREDRAELAREEALLHKAMADARELSVARQLDTMGGAFARLAPVIIDSAPGLYIPDAFIVQHDPAAYRDHNAAVWRRASNAKSVEVAEMQLAFALRACVAWYGVQSDGSEGVWLTAQGGQVPGLSAHLVRNEGMIAAIVNAASRLAGAHTVDKSGA